MRCIFQTFLGFSLITLFSLFILAQDPRVASAAGDKYVISAKAGGVNYIEGRVGVDRLDRNNGLLRRDQVEIGERVVTGSDGKAEFLLNPGSYLRVGPSSSFEFVSTSLDDLQLNLLSGSAIFEVIADDDFRISVKTPKSEIDLTRSGVYRIDVSSAGDAKLFVLKGKVFLGVDGDTAVKAGRTATINGSDAAVAKFDRDNNDPLEIWSKGRAKELAQTNARLQRNVLRSTLLNSYMSRGWNMYNSFGLWVFDPGRHMWCFLPFGSGWGSPYGFYYGLDTWNCGLPRWVYNQPAQQMPPSSSSPNPSKEPAARPIDNGDTHGRIRPPYQQMENNDRGSGEGVVNRRIGLPRDEGSFNPTFPASSSPASSAPVSSAPPPSAPAPSISLPSRVETKEKP
jgi:hypothetical protein